MRRPAWLAGLAVVTFLAFGASACTSSEGDKKMTVKAVTDALAQHKGDVAQPSPNNTVKLPDNWGNGLVLVSNDTNAQVTVNLPMSSGTPHKTADGTVVYLQDHSGGAVIPTKDGVQLLTVVKDADAPETYAYSVKGGSFHLSIDGRVAVTDEQSNILYVIQKPWAKDANGKEVVTSFEVQSNGAVLVQHIRHIGAAYPVTADPWWLWWMTGMVGGNMFNSFVDGAIGCGNVITWTPCRASSR